MASCECSSLEVPSVQELVSTEKPHSVPPRYIRSPKSDQDQQALILPYSLSSLHQNQIPVIDFQRLLHESTLHSELQLLHSACQQWGVFQLINPGVGTELMKEMKWVIQEFFSLSIQEKMKFRKATGGLEGYGQVFVVSEEQKLDWGDRFFIVTLPTCLRNPHLIPKFPPKFREAIESYSLELNNLATIIMDFMAKALNMKNEDDMKALYEEGVQSIRMNYYPPCPQPELVTGFTPHSDAVSLITILLQANEVDGLQVKKDGVWIPVAPLPNAFVVNIGDMMEIATNGMYTSVEHRATTNPEKERLSIATFLRPRQGGAVGPIPIVINHENPARFKRLGVDEYLKRLYSREVKGRTYLDTMRI